MEEKYKFKPEHLGMRCNVPYIYPLTIVSYNSERKLVKLIYSLGRYEHVEMYVPEEDINLEK
jgi:hypothetical protein